MRFMLQEEAALAVCAPGGDVGRNQLPCWNVQEVAKTSSGTYSEMPRFLVCISYIIRGIADFGKILRRAGVRKTV